MARDEHVPAAVGIDDPDLVATGVGQPTAVGRPLRVCNVLVRCGELNRAATAAGSEGHDQELAGTRDVLGIHDDPVARVEAELARRVDRDQALDRQPTRRRRDRRPGCAGDRSDWLLHRSSSGFVAAAGQPSRAAHGPIIA
jgi:hypothetical protein